jgi:TonB family protein
MHLASNRSVATAFALLFSFGAGAILRAAEPVVLTTASALALATKKVVPAYPDIAKQRHVVGQQEVKITVDASGAVTDAKVVKGSILLAGPSVAAAKQWKFVPLTKDGLVTAFETTLVFNFSPDSK